MSYSVDDLVASNREDYDVIKREAVLSIMIWGPTLALTALFLYLHLMVIAIGIIVIAGLFHTILRPVFPVFVLVFIIPCEWLFSIIPEITTASKIIAIIALFVSLPKIIQAIFLRWDGVALWILLFILWMGLGIFFVKYKLASFVIFQSMLLKWVGLPLLIVVNIRSEPALKGLLIVFVLGCLVSSAYLFKTGRIEEVEHTQQRSEIKSVWGDSSQIKATEDINIVGRYLAVGFIISIYFLLDFGGIFTKAAFLIATIIFAACVLLLKGRAVYLALPIALLTGTIFTGGTKLIKKIMTISFVLLFGGLVLFIMIKLGILGIIVEERFQSIFEEGTRAGQRYYLWSAHWAAFLQSGGFGRGIGMMVYDSPVGKMAHNNLLSIAAELGIVGLVSFLAMHVNIFSRLRKIDVFLPKLLGMMILVFIFTAAMTESDYTQKYYPLCLTLCWLIAKEFGDKNNYQLTDVCEI